MKTDTVTKTASISNNTLSDNRSNSGPQLFGSQAKQSVNKSSIGTTTSNSFGFGGYGNSDIHNETVVEQQAIIKSVGTFSSISLPTNYFVEYVSPVIKNPINEKPLAFIMKAVGIYDSINATLSPYPKKVMNFLS